MTQRRIALCLALPLLLLAGQSQAICLDNLQATTPDKRFEVIKDQDGKSTGVVRDLATGLMWTQCPVGYQLDATFGLFCEATDGETTSFDWQTALSTAQGTVQGKTGWRVPNIKELMSLVERACYNPAINTTVFPLDNQIGRYWTSTPLETNPTGENAGRIWVVDFLAGQAAGIPYDDPDKAYLRLVRDDDTASAP